MVRDILWHALVVGSQRRRLVGGHAYGVGNHADEYFVVPDIGQFEFLETEVMLAVKPYRFYFHSGLPCRIS
jgi:hypothetical protein